MKKYLIVLRNLAYFLTRGFIRSISQLHFQNKMALESNKNLHVIIMTGGLGDIVASEPTLRRIVRDDEHAVILVRPTYLTAFEFNPTIHSAIRVDSYVEALLLRRIFKSARWTNFHVDGHRCNMFQIPIRNENVNGINVDNYYINRTLADVYSEVVTGISSPDSPRIYIDPNFDTLEYVKKTFEIPELKLLVLHTQATETLRSWSPEHCRNIVALLLERQDINIIELGLNPVLEDGKHVHLLRNELSLSQQMALIEKADLLLSVDSGFAHVAKAVGLDSVILLGAYKKFPQYLPWHLGKNDILLRADGSINDISPNSVISAVTKLLALKV